MPYTIQQKADCVMWLAEFKSPILVKRKFHQKYGINVRAPPPITIKRWKSKFSETGTLERKKMEREKFVNFCDFNVDKFIWFKAHIIFIFQFISIHGFVFLLDK